MKFKLEKRFDQIWSRTGQDRLFAIPRTMRVNFLNKRKSHVLTDLHHERTLVKDRQASTFTSCGFAARGNCSLNSAAQWRRELWISWINLSSTFTTRDFSPRGGCGWSTGAVRPGSPWLTSSWSATVQLLKKSLTASFVSGFQPKIQCANYCRDWTCRCNIGNE